MKRMNLLLVGILLAVASPVFSQTIVVDVRASGCTPPTASNYKVTFDMSPPCPMPPFNFPVPFHDPAFPLPCLPASTIVGVWIEYMDNSCTPPALVNFYMPFGSSAPQLNCAGTCTNHFGLGGVSPGITLDIH